MVREGTTRPSDMDTYSLVAQSVVQVRILEHSFERGLTRSSILDNSTHHNMLGYVHQLHLEYLAHIRTISAVVSAALLSPRQRCGSR